MIHKVAQFSGGSWKSHQAGRGRPPAIPTLEMSTEAIAAALSAGVKGATGI